MDAIHSTWTKPRQYSCGHFFIEDFDILTTILSALKWRELNGKIKLVTDTPGLEFYSSRKMTSIWDDISTELDNIPHSINPEVFWAAGKLFALSKSSAPIAVIDTDFIVWQKLAFDTLSDLTVIHREDISPGIYPGKDSFTMRPEHNFDPDLDWNERPANAAFYIMKNDLLRKKYTDAAIDFMENAIGDDKLTYMVFAEQRLMAMIASLSGADLKEFSTIDKLFRNGDRAFTHTWGMKQQMREDPVLRHDFCMRCISRIITDFPEYEHILKDIGELQIYFTDFSPKSELI